MHPAVAFSLKQYLNATMTGQQTFLFEQGTDDHHAEMRFFPISRMHMRLVVNFEVFGCQLVFNQSFDAFGT